MPDVSIVAPVVSAAGTLLGALGGVALNSWFTVRREQAQATQQRKDQQTQARQQAYVDLLDAAAQLRIEIKVTKQRRWKDMNVKLAAIQAHAESAGLRASRVTLIASPETAEAARALASAAEQQAAATAKHTTMGYEGRAVPRRRDNPPG